MLRSNESQLSNIKTKAFDFFMLGKDLKQVQFGQFGSHAQLLPFAQGPQFLKK
jgi:hypothetical protein